MSTTSRGHRTTRPAAPDFNTPSFDYGYRWVRRKGTKGPAEWDRAPLTLEDVLHPQLGDVHVLSDPHTDDCTYLRTVLKGRYADDASVVVLSDCGIFWDRPGLKHHSPDLAVIFGARRRKGWTTFHVRKEKTRPSLIIEVASPKTRVLDVQTKVVEYARAGVPHYVVADISPHEERRRLELIAYHLEGDAYERAAAPRTNRVWLEPVRLFLEVKINAETGEDRLALVEPETGAEIGDYTAIQRALQEAEARAQSETDARKAAEARAQSETDARKEAEARVRAMEERLRQQEEELRRLRGAGPDGP